MRDVILALFIFGMIPFILMSPYAGLLIWSWLGYMNPQRLTFGFAYSFPWVEIVAIATLIGWVFSKEDKWIERSTISLLLFAFLGWTLLTTCFAAVPDSAWMHWERFAKVLAMVGVTLMLVKTRIRMHWLVWVIVLSIGFYGVKGGLFTLLTGGSHRVLGPAKSFIGDTNGLAQALCMTLPLMRYLQLQASRQWVRVGLGFAMFLTVVAILGTYSRGGLIGLTIVGTFLFLKGRRRILVLVMVAIIAVVAANFMPEKWVARMDTIHHARQTSSLQERFQSWEFAVGVALHHPVLGGGLKVYQDRQMWQAYAPEGSIERAIHSIYFRVLGEQGFVGLGIFLALLLASWRSCSKAKEMAGNEPSGKWARDLASMLQVCLIAFMAQGAATTLSYFDLAYQLMAMCGLLRLIVARSSIESGKSPAANRGSNRELPRMHGMPDR